MGSAAKSLQCFTITRNLSAIYLAKRSFGNELWFSLIAAKVEINRTMANFKFDGLKYAEPADFNNGSNSTHILAMDGASGPMPLKLTDTVCFE